MPSSLPEDEHDIPAFPAIPEPDLNDAKHVFGVTIRPKLGSEPCSGNTRRSSLSATSLGRRDQGHVQVTQGIDEPGQQHQFNDWRRGQPAR